MTESVSKVVCGICPHCCALAEGQIGFCRARSNRGGEVVSLTYGKVSALALDPIEKKPLRHFHPGSMILSVGATGCNMRCPFCQNHGIAQDCENAECEEVTPDALVRTAIKLRERGNIGLAFTYNEPLVGYEYVRDCAKLARQNGLKTVLVTNGMINDEPFAELLPQIDALNIDLKGFTARFYDGLRGDFETVKNTIEKAQKNCHVEVTTLVIPEENDSVDDMERQAAWLASLRPDIPLHLTRFYPRYHYSERASTPPETIRVLVNVARKHLRYVEF